VDDPLRKSFFLIDIGERAGIEEEGDIKEREMTQEVRRISGSVSYDDVQVSQNKDANVIY
jgi:hypothetical protein